MPANFCLQSIETAGNESKQWIEVRLRIDRDFDFSSKTEVDHLVRDLRSPSDLLQRKVPTSSEK